MRLPIAAVGLMLAVSSVQAAGNNPFKAMPKVKSVPPPTAQPVPMNGVSQDQVMALVEQRLALMAEQNLLANSALNVSQDDVLDSVTALGLIDTHYIYKDSKKGCYIYENAKSGEVVDTRCYRAVAKRLRDSTHNNPTDK